MTWTWRCAVVILSTQVLAVLGASTPYDDHRPGVTLPLRKSNSSTYEHVFAHDRARLQSHLDLVSGRSLAKDKRTSSYYAHSIQSNNGFAVYVKFVSQNLLFEGIIDTSRSNTFFGGRRPWHPGSTSVNTGQVMELCYGSACFSGVEFRDNVGIWDGITTGITASSYSFGSATHVTGWNVDADGIFGLGPERSSVGTIVTDPDSSIPNFVELIYYEGLISSCIFTLLFVPNSFNVNGFFSIGGIDTTKFTGNLTWISVTQTSPASTFWGFDAAMTYGAANTSITTKTAGIIDSGSVLTLIPSNAFLLYKNLTGATYDDEVDLYYLTPAQYANLQSLFFYINGTAFVFIPNAQIWPRSLNSAIGANNTNVYLIINDSGAKTGSGLDFMVGMTWMQRFFTAYDGTSNRLGFATTAYTKSTGN